MKGFLENLMNEIYVVTDIESDGPCPGVNSMLSLASVAIDATGKELCFYSANLQQLPGAHADPDTMDFWNKNLSAWNALHENVHSAEDVMRWYNNWIKELPGEPIFVGEPAGYDFTFVYWYLLYFGYGKPFSHSALDVKTFAMAALKCDYSAAIKRNFPKEWFDPHRKHTHLAIDDAREQAYIFSQIYKEIMS